MPSEIHTGYVTAREVAGAFRITLSNVYRLASENRWRKYRLNGRVRYRWDDVDTTLSVRAPHGANRPAIR